MFRNLQRSKPFDRDSLARPYVFSKTEWLFAAGGANAATAKEGAGIKQTMQA